MFDTVTDTSIFSKDSISKLTKLSYNRPKYNTEEEKDPIGTSYAFLHSVTSISNSLKLKGNDKYNLGFLFLYEMFTQSESLPINYGKYIKHAYIWSTVVSVEIFFIR